MESFSRTFGLCLVFATCFGSSVFGLPLSGTDASGSVVELPEEFPTSPVPLDSEEVAVRRSVQDLFDSSAASEGVVAGTDLSSTGDGFLRVLGWTLAVLSIGGALVLVLKKFTPMSRSMNAGGMVRVLGRTALSPRHTVFVLRVSNQKVLIVGVSGDRMVNLSEISDPTGVLGVDREFSAALDNYSKDLRGQGEPEETSPFQSRISSHVETVSAAEEGARGVPYRHEVQRIRGLLSSWKTRFVGEEGCGDSGNLRWAKTKAGESGK